MRRSFTSRRILFILGALLVSALVLNYPVSGNKVIIDESIIVNLPERQEIKGKIIITAEYSPPGKIYEAVFLMDNNRYFDAVAFDQGTGYITLMFDDGWDDTYTVAKPIMEPYKYVGTIAAVYDYIGHEGAMSLKQLRELADKGWEISSHSLSDEPLDEVPEKQMMINLFLSKSYLQQNYFPSRNFIIPYGAQNERLLRVAEKYYRSARAYEDGINDLPPDPFDIKIKSLEETTTIDDVESWIDETANKKLWLILVAHHVGDDLSGQYTIKTQLLGQILGYLSKSEVKVETYDKILQHTIPEFSGVKDNRALLELDTKSLKNGPHKLQVMIGEKYSSEYEFIVNN